MRQFEALSSWGVDGGKDGWKFFVFSGTPFEPGGEHLHRGSLYAPLCGYFWICYPVAGVVCTGPGVHIWLWLVSVGAAVSQFQLIR